MDGQRFDDLARVFSAPLNRKGFLAILAGIAAPMALSSDSAAKKRGKRQKRRNQGASAQGSNGNPICDALCSGDVPDPQFCGGFGNCGSDDDCIAQDPSRPICCTQSPGCGGAGEGACCAAPPATCSGSCTKDSDCPFSPDADCMCDLETNRCQTVLCGGSCTKDSDCQDYPGCTCILIDTPTNRRACGIEEVCENFCNKGQCGSGDPEGDSCVCDFETNTCATIACPGSCADNADCQEQGQADCACFFGSGVDVANAAEVEAAAAGRAGPAGPGGVGIEGEIGPTGPTGAVCATCLAAGLPCDASTECCGQLVCRGSSNGPSQEGELGGTCQRKPKPKPKKDRCNKHGQGCRRDNDCCAQAVCFKGKCGEKDSHCHNDGECAQGYSCQGGPLAPGHRRCRKNGRRNRNRRNKNDQKR